MVFIVIYMVLADVSKNEVGIATLSPTYDLPTIYQEYPQKKETRRFCPVSAEPCGKYSNIHLFSMAIGERPMTINVSFRMKSAFIWCGAAFAPSII